MSRTAGNQVPAPVRDLLAGDRLEEAMGLTVQLITIDNEGWPRLEMLNASEVLATSPRQLRLTLSPGGPTTGNMTRGGRATLALVHAGAAWYMRCSARRGRDLEMPNGHVLAAFALTVEETFEDTVPQAELTGGITFRPVEPERTLMAWQEALSALREG